MSLGGSILVNAALRAVLLALMTLSTNCLLRLSPDSDHGTGPYLMSCLFLATMSILPAYFPKSLTPLFISHYYSGLSQKGGVPGSPRRYSSLSPDPSSFLEAHIRAAGVY